MSSNRMSPLKAAQRCPVNVKSSSGASTPDVIRQTGENAAVLLKRVPHARPSRPDYWEFAPIAANPARKPVNSIHTGTTASAAFFFEVFSSLDKPRTRRRTNHASNGLNALNNVYHPASELGMSKESPMAGSRSLGDAIASNPLR